MTNAPAISFDLPSLEGKEIRTDAQKVSQAGPPRRMPGKTGVFYHFTAMGSARSTITNGYTADELKTVVISAAKLAKGDEIAGRKISSFGRDFDEVTKGGKARSGKHTRQYVNLSDGALAVVIEASYGKTLSTDPRKVLQMPDAPAKLAAPPKSELF